MYKRFLRPRRWNNIGRQKRIGNIGRRKVWSSSATVVKRYAADGDMHGAEGEDAAWAYVVEAFPHLFITGVGDYTMSRSTKIPGGIKSWIGYLLRSRDGVDDPHLTPTDVVLGDLPCWLERASAGLASVPLDAVICRRMDEVD